MSAKTSQMHGRDLAESEWSDKKNGGLPLRASPERFIEIKLQYMARNEGSGLSLDHRQLAKSSSVLVLSPSGESPVLETPMALPCACSISIR
jgi:hypothetical protein